jgi:voltage-gated potassium channel
MNKIRIRLYGILNVVAENDPVAKTVEYFLLVLISLNVLAVILESVAGLFERYQPLFAIFEFVSVMIFTSEYILRVWSCTVNERYRHPLMGRLRFVLSPMALVDMLAIFPFYLPIIIPMDLRFLRAMRLFRIFRILKIGRYSDALQLLWAVIRRKKEELYITGIAVVILLVIASSVMYYIERDVQPETFSSIPGALWWGIVTLSTVGYGDVYPATILGKIIGTFVALLGIGMFALPAGIIGSGFIEELQTRKRKPVVCPHCGRGIENDE